MKPGALRRRLGGTASGGHQVHPIAAQRHIRAPSVDLVSTLGRRLRVRGIGCERVNESEKSARAENASDGRAGQIGPLREWP